MFINSDLDTLAWSRVRTLRSASTSRRTSPSTRRSVSMQKKLRQFAVGMDQGGGDGFRFGGSFINLDDDDDDEGGYFIQGSFRYFGIAILDVDPMISGRPRRPRDPHSPRRNLSTSAATTTSKPTAPSRTSSTASSVRGSAPTPLSRVVEVSHYYVRSHPPRLSPSARARAEKNLGYCTGHWTVVIPSFFRSHIMDFMDFMGRQTCSCL